MKIEANKTEYKAEERKGLVGAEKNSRRVPYPLAFFVCML